MADKKLVRVDMRVKMFVEVDVADEQEMRSEAHTAVYQKAADIIENQLGGTYHISNIDFSSNYRESTPTETDSNRA